MAALVCAADGRAAVITEVEFAEVADEMRLAAMLVDARHAALEHREHVLDGVGVDLAANVLLGCVIDGAVLGELAACGDVELGLVSVELRFARGVLDEDVADL